MIKKYVALIALSGLVSACSTVTTGVRQEITVNTPHVSGAECTLKDTKNGHWTVNKTPETVTVRKGGGPMEITCSENGYKTTTVSLEEYFAGATMGNILLGGGVGIIVDAASGAAQKYPTEISIWMPPQKWASAKAKENWLREKAEYQAEWEKKYTPKKVEPENVEYN